jgi:hypothetical protein
MVWQNDLKIVPPTFVTNGLKAANGFYPLVVFTSVGAIF